MQNRVTVQRLDLEGRIYRTESLKLIEVRPTSDPLVAGVVILEDDLKRKISFDGGNGQPMEAGHGCQISPHSLRSLRRDFAAGKGQPSLPGIEPAFLAPGKTLKKRSRR
jgi:hypothetical protein